MDGTLRRLSRTVFAVLVIGCSCSGTVTLLRPDPDGSTDVTQNPWLVWFGGLLLLFVLGWMTYRLVRYYLRDWRLRLFGSEVWAVITHTESYLDQENDLVWEFRVLVDPPLGPAFTRSYGPHMSKPKPVGTRIRARYYKATDGLDISEKSIGNLIFSVIVDLIWLAIVAALLYSIGYVAWALISYPM